MNEQKELDWHYSAIKYYQPYRILIFLGYTKQAISSLCISIEKSLKVYIAIRCNLPEKDLLKFGHNLKKLFSKSKLKSTDYPIIHKICNLFVYNDIRYSFKDVTNYINDVYFRLDIEMKNLSRQIIFEFNKKYNSNVKLDRWVAIKQDRKYKQYFLERALKHRDLILRIDFT